MKDFNATQAAIRAGYSPDTAYSIGSELLKKPETKARIQEIQAARSARTGITAERVLQEYARLAFGDIRRVSQIDYDGSVRVLPTDLISEDDSACISEISETANGVKVKMHDKNRALDQLAKHLGICADQLRLEAGASFVDALTAARQRVKKDE